MKKLELNNQLMAQRKLFYSHMCLPPGQHPPEFRATQLQIQSTMMCKPSAHRCQSKWWRRWRWLMVKQTSSLLCYVTCRGIGPTSQFIFIDLFLVDVRFCLSVLPLNLPVCVGPSSWWPDFSEGEWERLGLDGLWRETDHLEDLPDRRGKGRVHRKDPETKDASGKTKHPPSSSESSSWKEQAGATVTKLVRYGNVLWLFDHQRKMTYEKMESWCVNLSCLCSQATRFETHEQQNCCDCFFVESEKI